MGHSASSIKTRITLQINEGVKNTNVKVRVYIVNNLVFNFLLIRKKAENRVSDVKQNAGATISKKPDF